MKNNFKKIALSFFVVVVFIFYVIYRQRNVNTPTSQPVVTNNNVSQTGQTVNNKYKDGDYTGKSANAYYGNIQVKASIKNGKIVDVVFLDYPKDRNTSVMINTQAMPLLKSEAIQAQSAQVDIISGATDSSGAFVSSLSSALSQAL